MSCCRAVTGNGGAPGECSAPICIDRTTLDASVIAIPLGTLAVVGSAITFASRLDGAQDNGQRGMYFAAEGNAARNAIGSGIATPILSGPVGYTDAAAVPWTTLGVPAGWGAFVAMVGAVLTLSFGAAAGQVVQWRGRIERWAHHGAVL